MPAFILTPQIKAKRRKMLLELAILKIKQKLFGSLSQAEENRVREIMLEFSKHY